MDKSRKLVMVFRCLLSDAAEAHEFGAKGGVVGETACIVECDRGGILLLHSTHLHAQVFRLTGHDYPLVGESFVEEAANLGRQTFLYLQAPGEIVDDAGKLGEPDHLAVGDVSHAYLSEEGEDMVLAHAVELYILDNHYPGAAMLEDGLAGDGKRVLAVALSDVDNCFCGTLGGLLQALAIRVFTHQTKYFTIMTGYLSCQFRIMCFFSCHNSGNV